jgi:hypothetical protein
LRHKEIIMGEACSSGKPEFVVKPITEDLNAGHVAESVSPQLPAADGSSPEAELSDEEWFEALSPKKKAETVKDSLLLGCIYAGIKNPDTVRASLNLALSRASYLPESPTNTELVAEAKQTRNRLRPQPSDPNQG